MTRPLFWAIAALALAPLMFGCTQNNTGDEPATASDVPSGIGSFLLFPNPGVQSAGGYETNSDAYADAYYRAIDPGNARDTLAKWKAQNGFSDSSAPQVGTEHLVVFRDTKDLGYGRRMTGRRNTADGNVAFFVENYSVVPNASGDYSSTLNVEAAIRRDTQWHVGTNAIEWSGSGATCNAGEDPANCAPTAKFAKFYNFSSADGTRQHFVNLDGKGLKAMPGACISCHGGRGDPLTPPDAGSGQPRFPLVENSVSRKRGDVQARLHGMNVASFGYSAQPGFSRAEQEAKLKDFNQWILCSYPTPAPAMVTGAWGSCARPTAGANEWQGTAGPLVEAWYGGTGMPLGMFAEAPVPMDWSGNPTLYTDVVAPFCRTCHILRGTANQNDIDFTTLAKFQTYADRIKTHVFDRGNMPLALIVYDDFWRSSAPQTLANFVNPLLIPPETVLDASGAPLKPGRPIADPGPNRMVRTGANAILNGENSLFATSYNWTLISGSATIANPNSMIATFNAGAAGPHTVRLTVGNGANTHSKEVTITVDNTFPDPSTLRVAQIKNVLQNLSPTSCASCHTVTAAPMPLSTPPIWYNSFDRDGSGGAANATDDAWFLKELAGRVNLTDIGASPLLRKPSGNSHAGGTLFNLSIPTGLRNYSILYNWILAGLPPGGLVANAGADSTENLVFAGSPATDTVSLDGSASIGATSYAWTIVSATPAPHPNGTPAAVTPASITQPSAALPGATLNVFDIGTYVVRLRAINGIDPDETDDRTITVTETAVNAVASPSGLQSLTFVGAPTASATLNLSSAGTTGNPLTYSWFYFPSGSTTGPCGTISNATSATATLTVPDTAVGQACTFRVLASNLSTTDNATIAITIGAAAGQNPNASYTATTTTRCTVTNGTTATPSAACTWAGNPFNATIGLSASASGVGTLTYLWSVTSGPAGSFFTNGTSPTATLNIVNDGNYGVRLFVDNGGLSTGTIVDKTITVSANRTFTQVRAVFTGPLSCASVGCHSIGNPPPFVGVNLGSPPSWDNVNDANGNSLYTRVLARLDLAAPASSLLVLNPLGSTAPPNLNGHGGGMLFTSENDLNYITFLTWIIGGAPNN